MNFSKEIQEEINIVFKNDEERRTKLLMGDLDTIRGVAIEAQKGMVPEYIVDAYESNDSKTKEELYKQAKRLVRLKKLYKDLCLEYYNKLNRSENEER